MTYRETIELATKYGLRAYDLLVAQECDWAFSFEYSDEQFEKLCEKARYVHSHSSGVGVDACCIACAINWLIDDNGKTIDDVLGMDFYDIHEVALNFCEY